MSSFHAIIYAAITGIFVFISSITIDPTIKGMMWGITAFFAITAIADAIIVVGDRIVQTLKSP